MSIAMSRNVNLPQFKGNSTTENGVSYYKTTKGTVAGAIMAIPAVAVNYCIDSLDPKKLDTKIEECIKKYSDTLGDEVVSKLRDAQNKLKEQEVIELFKTRKKFAIPIALSAGAITLGCGILYDKIRNKNSKKAAEAIASGNVRNVDGGYIDVSKKNTLFYKADNGIKYGAAAGAVCGLADSIIGMIRSKNVAIGSSLINMGAMALGGVILGAIVQKASNKAAEKYSYNA